MSKGMNDRSTIGGEWLFAFAGVGLASALVTVFLLTDPYWKLASIGTPVDETTTAVAELFSHDEIDLQEEDRIEFAFADVLLEPDPRRIARTGPAQLPDPEMGEETVVVAELDKFIRRAGPRSVLAPSRFDTLEVLAQSQAPRGYDFSLLESMMKLSRTERRRIQLRLSLAGHDPRGIDGVFGPATREAIAAFQAELGLPESGYLDAPLVTVLEMDTDLAYANWQRENSVSKFAKAVPEPRPQRSQPVEDKCVRDQSGEVIAYQGILCDLTGLGESIFRLEFANNAGRTERFAENVTRVDR
ncbi:MAG: peptidoglycan-binding domain-containing protein [Pseudomonadota bacterium]